MYVVGPRETDRDEAIVSHTQTLREGTSGVLDHFPGRHFAMETGLRHTHPTPLALRLSSPPRLFRRLGRQRAKSGRNLLILARLS
jgi:hypothetical protein